MSSCYSWLRALDYSTRNSAQQYFASFYIIDRNKNTGYDNNTNEMSKEDLVSQNNLLYFTEPFFFHKKGSEFIYLQKFLNYFKNKKYLKIKIKLHPLEKANKYDRIVKNFKNLNIKVIKNSKLENLINWCDKVYGCETYAMIIAKKCNRKVYTLMSPKEFRLPNNLIKGF